MRKIFVEVLMCLSLGHGSGEVKVLPGGSVKYVGWYRVLGVQDWYCISVSNKIVEP